MKCLDHKEGKSFLHETILEMAETAIKNYEERVKNKFSKDQIETCFKYLFEDTQREYYGTWDNGHGWKQIEVMFARRQRELLLKEITAV